MDARELAEIERRMEEEYRRDREALERLKRFMSNGDKPQQRSTSSEPRTETPSESEERSEGSIRRKVAEVFAAEPENMWSIPGMVEHLTKTGFPLKAAKPEASMYGVFRVLKERGIIRIVRRGSGSQPHLFRSTAADKDRSATATKDESRTATVSPSSQKLMAFLQARGPMRRTEIIEQSGIPAGTIANALTRKNLFRQRMDGKWEVIEGGLQAVS